MNPCFWTSDNTDTTNANCYCQSLQKLHSKIKKKKHLGELNDDIILLDYNACFQVFHRLQGQLNVVKGWEVFKHPAQNLDLLPNSFHLYGPSKKVLKGCMFMLDEEMWDAVVEWFRQQCREFFAHWIN